MANRIVGNVLIIDSAMGNSPVVLNTQIKSWHITAIAFWAINTTGACLLTGTNTASDLIFKHDLPAGSANTQNPKWFPFGSVQELDDIKIPTLTAGTAFIYLA